MRPFAPQGFSAKRSAVLQQIPDVFERLGIVARHANMDYRDARRIVESLSEEGVVRLSKPPDGDVYVRRRDGGHARPDLERVFLGAVLDGKIPAGNAELKRQLFWDRRHISILGIVGELEALGRGVSTDAVWEMARMRDQADEIGGEAYLRVLAPLATKSALEEAAGEVEGLIALRRAREKAAFDKDAPMVGAVMQEGYKQLLARAKGEDQPVPTAWPSVSSALSGGFGAGVHAFVAATGVGKTCWHIETAIHAARSGYPVLYVGLEMKRAELTARLLGAMSDVPWSDFNNGNDLGALEAACNQHAATLSQLPLRFVQAEPFRWSPDRLHAQVEKLVEQHPGENRPLVIIDYLQLVGAEDDSLDTRRRIGEAAVVATAIAREFDAAVLLVSSTSRQHYNDFDIARTAKNSKLSDLKLLGSPASRIGTGKESGEIEYSADTVLTLVRVREPDEHGIPAGGARVYLGVAKQRAGPTHWVPLLWHGFKFTEPLAIPPPPAAAAGSQEEDGEEEQGEEEEENEFLEDA